jgi:hypothetical protein
MQALICRAALLAGSNPPRMQNLVPYPGAKDRWTFEPDAALPGKPSGTRAERQEQ